MADVQKPDVYMAGRAGAKAAPTSKTSVTQQRQKLRSVFDRFDTDGSGAVSTLEMSNMVAMLKLDMTTADIAKLMAEADPDGSGEISFEEFVQVIRKQMNDGGSSEGLAAVVAEAGNAFGWLNPLTWFSQQPAAEPEEASRPTGSGGAVTAKEPPLGLAAPGTRAAATPARSSPGRPPHSPFSPPGSADSPGTAKYYARSPESMRSSLEFTPTHRMKATQGLVQAANAELATEMKRELSEAHEWRMSLNDKFLARQSERIEKSRQQKEETTYAVEQLKYKKRYEGWEMKSEMKKAWQEAQTAKSTFAQTANKRVHSAKKRKARMTSMRHRELAEHSMAASVATKVERSQRREQALSTKRSEEQLAKEYAAQVRYETRPEVRQEGRDMFQAQRNATTASVKRMQEENASKIAQQKQAYLEKQEMIKAKVESMHAVARASRGDLVEERKQKAAEMRRHLEAERARKEEQQAKASEEVKSKRDAVYVWHKLGIVEP